MALRRLNIYTDRRVVLKRRQWLRKRYWRDEVGNCELRVEVRVRATMMLARIGPFRIPVCRKGKLTPSTGGTCLVFPSCEKLTASDHTREPRPISDPKRPSTQSRTHSDVRYKLKSA
jgi:hypothetical protein